MDKTCAIDLAANTVIWLRNGEVMSKNCQNNMWPQSTLNVSYVCVPYVCDYSHFKLIRL